MAASGDTTYKINRSTVPRDARCATVTDKGTCGHTIGVHGSNGMICAACPCRAFTMPPDDSGPARA